MEWTIVNARLVLPQGVQSGGLRVIGGRIAEVGSGVTAGAAAVDAEQRLLLPGLVDIHCHGGGGRDVLEDAPDGLAEIGRAHARFGTTSWLPTTWSVPKEALCAAVARVRKAVEQPGAGPEVLGVHLEGPYLNPEQKGAHDPALLRRPTPEEYEDLFRAGRRAGGGCVIRHWTVAPEVPGVMEFTWRARAEGVSVAIGHTQTTYEVIAEAVRAGAGHVTHLYNAMQGIHRGPISPGQGDGRLPGVVGAALDLDGLTVEVICDGVHVHPALVRLALRCKGLDKVALVSDAMSAAGQTGGDYYLSGDGRSIAVDASSATLAQEAGKLASSRFPLLHMVRTAVEKVGLPLPQAVRMAAENPARVIGAPDRKGRLAVGADADFFLMDDDWRVRAVWGRGARLATC
jgi:N-acetylglucosamine-6-phosphate deacetylase